MQIGTHPFKAGKLSCEIDGKVINVDLGSGNLVVTEIGSFTIMTEPRPAAPAAQPVQESKGFFSRGSKDDAEE